MHFVVTGCGRSGTGYASKLLTAAGVPCGHEAVFGPKTRRMEWRNLVADSSWLAVPFLRPIRAGGYRVYHQVRNPIEVLRSTLGIKFFARPRSWCEEEPYLATIWRFDKSVFSFDDPLRRAMSYWIRWNLAAEVHARFTYRLEDLDAPLLGQICADAGEPISEAAADEAVKAADRRYNHKARDESVDWHTLPSDPITPIFCRLAERYGYAPS